MEDPALDRDILLGFRFKGHRVMGARKFRDGHQEEGISLM